MNQETATPSSPAHASSPAHPATADETTGPGPAGDGRRALIVVDVQVAADISAYIDHNAAGYDAIVATLDWHIDPGDHFSPAPDYTDSWPVHCVAGTPGAQPHPDLDTTSIQAWFRKGAYEAAYSGFEGSTGEPPVTLTDWLARRSVQAVDVVGIATDHCVRATALDAVRAGLRTRVLTGLTAGVNTATTVAAVDAMRAAGVTVSEDAEPTG